jgi:molecular chaperone GrpE
MDRTENSHTVATEPDATREQLKADLIRERDMHLRTLADFDNYRRRVERDRAQAAAEGKRELILPLLEVLDGFDRALPYLAAAPQSVSDGVWAIHRRLLDVLEAQQVRPFNAIGERFDPALHEAIGMVKSEEYPSGTIVDEMQRGYRLGDEVIRPARVRVAS